MTAWIVVPVKPPGAGKSRLAAVLGDPGRRTLIVDMLARVARAAGTADARLHLLGATRHGLPEEVPLIADPGTGLNDALAAAIRHAAEAVVERLLFVSSDLPLVTPADIAALLDGAGTIAIAPDRFEAGTNALSLPLPAARDFRPAYGIDSFRRHADEAARIGLAPRIVRSATLGLDIDTAEDLALLHALRPG